MNLTEDQLRYALRESAEEFPATMLAPLRLPASATDYAGAGARPQSSSVRSFRTALTPGRLAPLAAAAAVIAIIATVASVTIGGASHRGAAGTRPLSDAQVLARAPQYYLAVTGQHVNGPYRAVVRATRTGTVVATVSPPRPYHSFLTVAAAGDDRTFVLGAQTRRQPVSYGPIKLFLARLSPAAGRISLTPLPVEVPARTVLEGVALSSDGRSLAVALGVGRRQEEAQISVYSLATGAVRVWQDQGFVGPGSWNGIGSMSWAGHSTLAVNYQPSQSGADLGIWLLNTATAGGSLRGHSRLAVCGYQPGGLRLAAGLLAGGGASIVAPAVRAYAGSPGPACAPAGANISPTRNELWRVGAFSAATGRVSHVLLIKRSQYPEVLYWVNAAGTTIVIQAMAPHHIAPVFGVAAAGRFVPLPHPPPYGLTVGVAF
jgi:hypothetical protein